MLNATQRFPDIEVFSCSQARSVEYIEPTLVKSEYFQRKALWIRILGAMLLAVFSPLIALLMLLVRMTSSGPALFRQTRLGKDGQPFELFKLRTMYCDAEDLSGPMLCRPGDSRITPVGRLLRFLHLDELPQLLNVVRGEMCLVGPRPERPEIIARHKLNEQIPRFIERIKVLPGVTGLAQINLPADQSAECVIPKVQLDLEYIATASAGIDLRILLCTTLRMLGVRHGRAVKLFRVNRSVSLCLDPSPRTNGTLFPQAYQPHAPHLAEVRSLVAASSFAESIVGDSVRPATSYWALLDPEKESVVGDELEELATLPNRPR